MGQVCTTCGSVRFPDAPTGIDWEGFRAMVQAVMTSRELSLRYAAKESGVDFTAIHRLIKYGRPVKAEAYVMLAHWCGQHLARKEEA